MPDLRILRFACPRCRTALEDVSPGTLRCPTDAQVYRRIDGIWRFLDAEQDSTLRPFLEGYQTVRRAEGWGSADPAYYWNLPFTDTSGRHPEIWNLRARSYLTLVKRILRPLEGSRDRPLRVLDLGAGNGWLSHRLSTRGHFVAALDICLDQRDGLGAHVHYPRSPEWLPYIPIQATFDLLPLPSQEIDLTIFNGAAHYSTSYERTFAEALRVLRPDGRLLVMDSPFYRWRCSGESMLREREAEFTMMRYQLPPQSEAEGFFTRDRLEDLHHELGIEWRILWPRHGWRPILRRWKTLLHGGREPARFPLLLGRSDFGSIVPES